MAHPLASAATPSWCIRAPFGRAAARPSAALRWLEMGPAIPAPARLAADCAATRWLFRNPWVTVLVSRSQVHALAKFLAGFEMRHVLAGKCDGVAGLGVAADSGRPEVKAEAAESANLYPVAAGQRCAHLLDDGSNRQIHVGLTEMLLLVGQLFDQLGLGHAITP